MQVATSTTHSSHLRGLTEDYPGLLRCLDLGGDADAIHPRHERGTALPPLDVTQFA